MKQRVDLHLVQNSLTIEKDALQATNVIWKFKYHNLTIISIHKNHIKLKHPVIYIGLVSYCSNVAIYNLVD